jgi:hypothetical protein
MKDVALALGISPREAERCLAVAELDKAQIKKLQKDNLVGPPVRRRGARFEIPPFWGGEFFGLLPSVTLVSSNMYFVPQKTIRAGQPKLSPLNPELFEEDVKLLDMGMFEGIVRDDVVFEMEGAGIEFAVGAENRVAQEDKVKRVIKPFSEGLDARLRDAMLDEKANVTLIPLKAPLDADLYPRIGRNGWEDVLSFRQDRFLYTVASPVLSNAPRNSFVDPFATGHKAALKEEDDKPEAEKVGENDARNTRVEWRSFSTCTGKFTRMRSGDHAIGIGRSTMIEPTAIILGQWRSDGRHEFVVIPAPAAMRIASACVSLRAHPSFLHQMGGALLLPWELIPAKLLGEPKAKKEEKAVEQPKRSDKAANGSGGTTFGDLIKAKNQSIGLTPTEGTPPSGTVS